MPEPPPHTHTPPHPLRLALAYRLQRRQPHLAPCRERSWCPLRASPLACGPACSRGEQSTFSVFFDINFNQARAGNVLQYMQARSPVHIRAPAARPCLKCDTPSDAACRAGAGGPWASAWESARRCD